MNTTINLWQLGGFLLVVVGGPTVIIGIFMKGIISSFAEPIIISIVQTWLSGEAQLVVRKAFIRDTIKGDDPTTQAVCEVVKQASTSEAEVEIFEKRVNKVIDGQIRRDDGLISKEITTKTQMAMTSSNESVKAALGEIRRMVSESSSNQDAAARRYLEEQSTLKQDLAELRGGMEVLLKTTTKS